MNGSKSTPFVLVTLALMIWTGLIPWAQAGPIGEALYRRGLLPSGQPLRATREANASIEGVDAACVNCHRRSGLGTTEGRITIPPITGQYLFHPHAQETPFVDGARADRDPYTDATLARAIREGVAPDGHSLGYLMPRYRLDDTSMAELIAYLKGLTPGPVPGVTESVLHFATIITPDADPVARQGMLDVLEKYFFDKNAAVRADSPRLYSTRPMMFRVLRRWELHVWQLTGPPEAWGEQLRKHLAAEPVFAVISGLGGRTWEPVHRFCEEQSLPCLFPNVAVPVVRETDFYSVYFSKGTLLEARLISQQLEGEQEMTSPRRRVIQLFRVGDIGEVAAAALRTQIRGGPLLVDRALERGGGDADLRRALQDVGPRDALVLWLRPKDIQSLATIPVQASVVWMSGLMGGLEGSPVPASWRGPTRMAYPFDLPDKRRVRVDYALGWFSIRHIPVAAQQVQADTYLACGLLAETLSHMVDTFVRDYLLERIESSLDHRIITGYYPHLALAPGQRFASKGAYLVHFSEDSGPRIVADGDWIVP